MTHVCVCVYYFNALANSYMIIAEFALHCGVHFKRFAEGGLYFCFIRYFKRHNCNSLDIRYIHYRTKFYINLR